MSTGVSVSDEVVAEFNEFKLGRKKSVKFIVYKIENGQIVKELEGTDASFDAFLGSLPADDCRYAVYDMDFTTNDGRPSSKLVSIAWSPDTAKVKSKMVYAGSKDALTRAFQGVATKITATDLSELTYDIVVEACRKFA